MEDNNSHTSSLRDIYVALFWHKKSILAILIATFLIAVVGVSVWPETYEARSRLLVKVGRENVTVPIVPPTSQHQVVALMSLRREDINSEIAILSDSRIVEQVVEKLGIDYLTAPALKPETFFRQVKYEFRMALKKMKDKIDELLYYLDLKKRLSPSQEVVIALREKLSAEQVRDSDAIEVRLRWSDPRVAEEVLQNVIDLYLGHHFEAHRMSGGYEFFQKQVEALEEHLRDSEETLKKLKESRTINSYRLQRDLLLGQIDRFDASSKATDAEIAESRKKCGELKEQLDSLRSSIPPGFIAVSTEAEKQLLFEEVRLESLLAKQNALRRHIESYQKKAYELIDHEFELKRLEREIEISEVNYKLYRTKLEETRISDVLDAEKIANVKVINTPEASIQPVRPKKLLVIGLGMVVSVLVSIGFTLISEYFDHSIRTAEDVQRYLDLRILASLPERKRCLISKNTRS